jgi:DNA-binding NarL/FixJ family response regulator
VQNKGEPANIRATGAVVPILESDRRHLKSVTTYVILIEERALLRECLTACLKEALGPDILSFANVESWLKRREQSLVSLVVLSTGARWKTTDSVQREVRLLNQVPQSPPVILLSDTEAPDQIIQSFEQGARGYIPTSASFGVAIEAMRLVKAGGIYAPATSLLAGLESPIARRHSFAATLTSRQTAVLDALRMGKANKLIAYDLNMCESTVKVHVRNLMKKFKAKNRTELAYIARRLIDEDST